MNSFTATPEAQEAIPYRPERAVPSPARHAYILVRWSMYAASLVLVTLLATRFIGLERPLLTPPLATLAIFYLCISPIAYYVHTRGDSVEERTDRVLSGTVLALDISAGSAILFFTGGPESVFLMLAPVVPFALRLSGSLRYTIAYAVALTASLAVMITLQVLGAIPHSSSLFDNPPSDHVRIEIALALTGISMVVASVIMSDSIARLLRRRESEALAFSHKMNLRAEKLSLLLQVGTLVCRSGDFDVIARRALTYIHDHFRADATVLYLREPAGGNLETFLALGPAADTERQESALALAAMRSGQACLWPSTVPDDGERRSAMVVPLLSENTGYGAIKIVAPAGDEFNQSKLALLDTLATELGTTLRTADIYQRTNAELVQTTKELSALTKFTRKVNSTLELRVICRELLNTAQRMTGSDYAQVVLFADEGDVKNIAFFSNYPPEVERRLRETTETEFRQLHERTLRTGKSFVVDDIEENSEAQASAPDARSKLCVPIVLQSTVLGMVVLENARRRAHTDSDVGFVEALCESTAVSVQNARLYKKVQQLAITDGMTLLFDHSHFHRIVQEEVERALRYERPLSLIMLDVDDFKGYNDAHGHPAGDEVLEWLGRILRRHTRKIDLAARYGGDEFAILMPETGPEGVSAAADNILRATATEQPEHWPSEVTVSIGTASLPDDAPSALDLVRVADQRMYRAKDDGKNQVMAG